MTRTKAPDKRDDQDGSLDPSREAYTRIMSNLPELAAGVVRQLAVDIAAYGQLPDEELAGDILHAIERSIRLSARSFLEKRMPDEQELTELRASAGLRADEGIPLESVIAAYHLGARIVWDELTLEDDRPEFLRAMQDHVLRYLQVVVPVVAAGYVDARWSSPIGERGARSLLLAALLGEEVPSNLLPATGAPPAQSYAVLCLHIGAHPDEGDTGVDPHIVARRKIRRMLAEAEMFAKGPVPSSIDSGGGLILLPFDKPADRLEAADWKRIRELIPRLSAAGGAEVRAAADVASTPDVAASAKLARDVLEVVVALGKPPGLYRLPDVRLEYQLTRPGPARDQLAALIEPITGKPDLLDTLTAFLRLSGNRRKAATALHVHPNTVDYRLGRVAELTGLDPSDANDLHQLAAACAVHAVATRQAAG